MWLREPLETEHPSPELFPRCDKDFQDILLAFVITGDEQYLDPLNTLQETFFATVLPPFFHRWQMVATRFSMRFLERFA